MSCTSENGRLGNQIIRNLVVSMIAKKHDLYVDYCNYSLIKKIGIDLYVGSKKHKETKKLTDNNFFEILSLDDVDFNLDPNYNYFQTKQITDVLHKYLNSEEIMTNIINSNKYKTRYNNNNDCFIHIRLGDVANWNPGFKYYDKILSTLNIENIYISTDSPNHDIIVKLKEKYPKIIMIGDELDDIIMFGSTNKYVILSYGTFSANIGFLSYYSTVFCLPFCEKYAWDWNATSECDMFRDKSTKIGEWIIITP
jgi:hypothetical protein